MAGVKRSVITMMSPSVIIVIGFVFTAICYGQLEEIDKTDGSTFEAAFQGKCGPLSPCVQLCVELHDGTFECQCRTGYRLLVDGYSCVELTNTTLSDDSSEEEEEEEEWRQRERQQLELQAKLKKEQQQQQGKEARELPSGSSSRTSTTVTRDTTSEYKRSSSNSGGGKNLAGAAAAAARAASQTRKNLVVGDDAFDDSSVRPLPQPLASLSGNKPMTRKPKKPKMTADAVVEAMNKAAEAAFTFDKAPPRPTMIPPQQGTVGVTSENSVQVGTQQKKDSLLEGAAVDENYEDDYEDDEEESKEGEEEDDDDSSEEEYDDEEEDEDELSLEGQEDLEKLKALTSGVTTSSGSTRSLSAASTSAKSKDGGDGGGEIIDDSEELLISSPESSSKIPTSKQGNGVKSKFQQDLYSTSYVDGDAIREGVEFTWDKDGKQQQASPPSSSSILESSSTTFAPSSSSSPSTTERPEVECPLKCNRGSCTREPSTESGMEQSMTGYRCLCPMGTRGTFCEVDEIPEEGGGYNSGLFRGQSWVAFPVLHDAYMSDQISLEFRPESESGILLLTGEREDLSGDFLALYIRDGYLEFRFDCGSGYGMVRSATPVLLQQWNRASIVRRRWDGWMQLNDGPFTQGRSKGLFSRITFRQPVFIGGPGNITFTATGSTPTNFDDEPELSPPPPLSSSTTLSLSSSSSSSAPFSPSLPSSEPSNSWSPVSHGSVDEFFVASASVVEDPSASGSSSTALPNSSNSLSENSSTSAAGTESADSTDDSTTSIASLLKKTGGFRGCIRNLAINDRAYRFGLEPAGDSLQGFDIESCNDQGVCDLVKCQHGGQCLVQKDENPTCLCPLGFSGPFCETPLDLQIPSFNGSSYLKYSGLGLTRVLSWLELEIVVKPDAMDGLILYNGYKTDGMGDFIALTIDQGYFEFAMDLGTGTAIVRSESSVSLGDWHRILISRTSRLISIKVDNQPPVMALTPGAFTQLSLPHNLFLGGIPDPQWLSPKVKVHGGFSGCIQKLVVNERPLRIMGSAMSGVNLENCAHPCLRNPCDHGGDCIPQLDSFKCHCPLGYRDPYCQTRMDKEDIITAPRFIGDSYLRFTHPRVVKRISGWKLSLSFRVRTSVSRGILLWAGRKWMTSASDFISVGLRNGFVTASFSLGSGQTTIAYNVTAINDGQWHHVHFFRNEQEASLAVDDGPPVTGVAPGKLRQLNINDGLYIGGLEDPRHQSMNKYTEGLVGCLTDLVLGGNYRVSLLQEASEGRNVDYCD